MLVHGVREVNWPKRRVTHLEDDILPGAVLGADDQVVIARPRENLRYTIEGGTPSGPKGIFSSHSK